MGICGGKQKVEIDQSHLIALAEREAKLKKFEKQLEQKESVILRSNEQLRIRREQLDCLEQKLLAILNRRSKRDRAWRRHWTGTKNNANLFRIMENKVNAGKLIKI